MLRSSGSALGALSALAGRVGPSVRPWATLEALSLALRVYPGGIPVLECTRMNRRKRGRMSTSGASGDDRSPWTGLVEVGCRLPRVRAVLTAHPCQVSDVNHVMSRHPC